MHRARHSTVLRRSVCVAHRCPPTYPVVKEDFPSNKIVTSKYTIWNFLPVNLLEQFRRIANFYFLCIAAIQLCIRSPVSPATSLMPLMFVVTVTAVKQAYEDWLRHKADNIANHMPVDVYKNGKMVTLRSQDVMVGDIVKIVADQEAPCDLVLLSSANDQGRCHITTANLDGETNLKVHECPEHTLQYTDHKDFKHFYAVIECGPPTASLYQFNGKITVFSEDGEDRKISPLNKENLLLRGATLKNTPFVFGCAIFTGPETKMVMNLKLTRNKFSSLEKTLNRVLLVFLGVMLIEASISTALYFKYDKNSLIGRAWYIPYEKKNIASGFEIFLSFAVLFNYIIPISLYVTLEMVKFIGAKFFVWDLNLYDRELDEPAVCNTSDLNEELGQVQCLFSDKTGTLTQNCMEFRQCFVEGANYEDRDGQLLPTSDKTVSEETLEHFLCVLALCNTVEIRDSKSSSSPSSSSASSLPSKEKAKKFDDYPLEYFASSPDEKSLVEACAKYGVVLYHVTGDECVIKTSRGLKKFKKLCTLEFTSERKRMSTIIEDENGDITLYCKGADIAVLPRSKQKNKEAVHNQISAYSLAGYRSLAVAQCKLERAIYQNFIEELKLARCQLVNREYSVAEVFDSIEKNLQLIGATAVEDRLQLGVPETLEALRVAGIKVWVLTGDHNETALNISLACGHISRDMVKLELLHQQSSDQCFFSLTRLNLRIEEEMRSNFALVIDGISLGFAIEDHPELLKKVTQQCVSVLCSRLSPLQKAEVVKLVKHSSENPITAAIGDGANDVSMIQEAHVGLGIIGKEGRQAVRCSDFAFTQFQFLKRVFLVHGQYYYIRAAILIQYFFYKNVAFIGPQFIYIFYNGYTPQPIYNSVFLMFFNIFFTSLPIFVYGCTEKHLKENTLMENPILYRSISKNHLLQPFEFFKWVLYGLWHCLVFYFGVSWVWHDGLVSQNSSLVLGMWSFGTMMFHTVVIAVNIKLLLHTKHWTPVFIISVIISIFGFIGFCAVYTGIYWTEKVSLLYGVYMMALESTAVWFMVLLLVVLALIPDVIIVVLYYHNVSLRRTLFHVCNQVRRPHRYFRFSFSRETDQSGVNSSQINIFHNAFESEEHSG